MDSYPETPLVSTIKELCGVCYACVRECPAKAIRVRGGQAEVITERCIGCGNCVRVCSRRAKKVLSSVGRARALIESAHRVAACLAPSFPAEFVEMDPKTLAGMVRRLGFDLVCEVGFGADLVARRYRRLLDSGEPGRYIAANCPAIVEYVQRFHPELVGGLARVVSPMIAEARALHRIYGADLKIVFIGPCIAKKAEKEAAGLEGDVDAVLTFTELRSLFERMGISPANSGVSEFDPPHPGAGSLFPVSRGMLQAANISDDLLPGDVVAADGRGNFIEAIKEFENGDLNVRLLETLCCNGCIMGPGISSDLPLFRRRERVLAHVRERLDKLDHDKWWAEVSSLDDLDLSRDYEPNDKRTDSPTRDEVREILASMGKTSPEDELNCGACGYDSCLEHAVAIHRGLAESEMCLPYTIDQLKKTVKELALSNERLAGAREALVQSEKLAGMGRLAAGIAHEINNPLGVVLMYSHMLLEDADPGSSAKPDLEMIVEQTDRCKKIVAGLLNFARQNTLAKRPAELSSLVDAALRGLDPPGNVTIARMDGDGNKSADLDGDQVTQVLTNLIENAFDAMPEGGQLKIETGGNHSLVHFIVEDEGCGIKEEDISRIFDPFFTTKKLGKGTGLGLAVAYGIVKMHGGDLKAESNADGAKGKTGSRFTVSLPRGERQ